MLKVTFDTSVLEHIVAPAKRTTDGEGVLGALRDGRIRGFIGEAVAALDVVGKSAKVDMVATGQVLSKSRATGPKTIEISVGPAWTRPALHPQSAELLDAAFDAGIKMLIGPRRFLDLLPPVEYRQHYESYASTDELVVGSDKTHEVATEIAARGLGQARAIALGLKHNVQVGKSQEWWVSGLRRAIDKLDEAERKAARKEVRAVVNEWADGDAIAAHVGYGNDLFCTRDFARDGGRQSVFHTDNRAWLESKFGVKFVTLAELAACLRSHDR